MCARVRARAKVPVWTAEFLPSVRKPMPEEGFLNQMREAKHILQFADEVNFGSSR